MASSSAPRWKYDVFLSFRGEDVRKNFVDHLYDQLCQKGFYTFKDDQELGRGKQISLELLKAIEQSRLALIIFSETYASSSWCLDELVKILECKNDMGQIVVPVFYKVDAFAVRKQTGSFAAAFSNHEEVFGKDTEKVGRWRRALREAANISGWTTETTADGYESKCIQEIIRDIFNKLGHTILSVHGNKVGIESRVDEVCSLLNTRLDDVQLIGMWGMGGIGKTTIARAVYDQITNQFEDHIFLEVGEFQEKHGLRSLQKELLLIVSRLRYKRVLVVLDDVDQIAQLDISPWHIWVGSGSRIIITSRDAHLLVTLGVDKRYILEVKALDGNEALQLFCSKAFKESYPSKDYVNLSYDVVHYAAGLPLAIKVLGSSLFGRSKDEWEGTLKRLKKIPDKDIFQVLKISFDRLNELEQKIFLDIACFFKGENKDIVTKTLDVCGFEPSIGICVLIEKSLITVSSANTLEMHSLIQEMGRYIVRHEDIEEPGRRSRLCFPEDIFHALIENTVTDKVEGICLDLSKPKDMSFNMEVFKKMNKLRLLKVHNAQISYRPEYLSNRLSWLDWQRYPFNSLPTSFTAEKLVKLCMHYSRITELWKGTKILNMLKSIDLSHSQKLKRTPDLTGLPNLEELVLEDCTGLVEVHPSVAFHKQLILLNLRNCENLKSLADSIQLESLNILILSGCRKLEKFPVILGKMENLSMLHLDGTAVEELPSSIEQLSNLILMNLKDSRNLTNLPNNICKLRSLQTLELSGCKGKIHQSWWSHFLPRKCQNSLGFVVPSFSPLSSLKMLFLRDCNILDGVLPSDIGCLSSLWLLDLTRTNIVNLPTSIIQLCKLEYLFLVGCNNLEALPKLPSRLQQLYPDDCTSLQSIPNLSSGYIRLERISLCRIKLNTAVRGNPGRGGFGGLFRNEEGVWIGGYYGKLTHSTNLEAELWAICRGLTIIFEKGMSNVEIETDSQEAKNLIQKGAEHWDPCRALVEDARMLLNRCQCTINHSFRECNQCAEALANIGVMQTEDLIVLKEPPESLLQFLLADLVGRTCSRN